MAEKNRRVLVVDDDNTMREFVRGALELEGYAAVCVPGGQEGIDMLKEQSFDCVLLDFGMPGKDGFDVVSSMYKRGDKTPVIVFTSVITPIQESGMNGLANVRGVIKKPCSVDTLLRTVEDAVRQE